MDKFVELYYCQSPLPLKRPYPSFLEDFDQHSSSPAPKRFCPESVNGFITQWVESTVGSESYEKETAGWILFWLIQTATSSLGGLQNQHRIWRIHGLMRDSLCHLLCTLASTESRSYTQPVTSVDAAGSACDTGQSLDQELFEKPSYSDLNLQSSNI